jgi:hypothetical protein
VTPELVEVTISSGDSPKATSLRPSADMATDDHQWFVALVVSRQEAPEFVEM